MNEQYLKIINSIDNYVKFKEKVSLVEFLVGCSVEDLIVVIFKDEEIRKLILDNYCLEPIYYYIEQIKFQNSEKSIPRIYDKDIILSKNPEIETNVSNAEIKMVFCAVKNNVSLYEKLYETNTYKIKTTLKEEVKVEIPSSKLFHLFGMNFREWQKKYKQDILILLPELSELLEENYIKLCTDNDPRLYEAVKIIINNEEKITKSIKENANIAKAFPIPKMKAKCFAFERLGFIESPAGIIFYDKNKNPDIKKSVISSDFFILRDFMMDYQLRWIFSGYTSYGKKVKNAETLLLEKDTSGKFINQKISISSSIITINKSTFDFKVSSVIEETEFSGGEMAFVASKIIESFPHANLEHLEEFLLNNQNAKQKTI